VCFSERLNTFRLSRKNHFGEVKTELRLNGKVFLLLQLLRIKICYFAMNFIGLGQNFFSLMAIPFSALEMTFHVSWFDEGTVGYRDNFGCM
jgi:hypothetical protein